MTTELQRREAYLAEAQKLSHTGSFGWRVSTDEHFWSDETFRIFEFAPSAIVSLPRILERVHPQDMPALQMAIAAAYRAEGIDFEFRLLMPDARIKYLHVVGKTERDDTSTMEVIGAVMDVTARKLTEIELRRSKVHLADAQRLSRSGSVGMDVSTKRIFWSDEAARIYGYPPGTEPTPDLILQRAHPDDVGVLADVLGRAGQGGYDFDCEHRLLMPDGSIKHIHNLAHSVRDETGNEEIVGAIMDVTERKVSEHAIRRSEAYLAEAQRLSHTGSFGWKPDTGEIVWSDETYRIFEYDRAEKPHLDLDLVFERIHPQDRTHAQQIVHSASTSGSDFECECRLLMPGGAVKHLHVRAHALPDSSANIEFVGAVTDVTERKRAEQERERLHQLQAQLSHLNRVTTMGELAASLAHEIKQPIAAAKIDARVCVRALAGDRLDVRAAREAAARLMNDATRADEIIERTTALYRKGTTPRERVNVNEVIREMILLVQQEASVSSIAIRTELAEGIPDVIADRVQLQQVLMNLMLNAIEAMKDTGGDLLVASNVTEDSEVLIVVRDTGSGLPADNPDQIFEAFVTTKPHGTGMGLAITRSIVKSHGGRLWAERNAGPGASFHCALPAVTGKS